MASSTIKASEVVPPPTRQSDRLEIAGYLRRKFAPRISRVMTLFPTGGRGEGDVKISFICLRHGLNNL